MAKSLDLESAAAFLEQSPDYRILRRLTHDSILFEEIDGDILTGIVLDVETTGLDYDLDQVIELGMIKFTFSRTGQVGSVVDTFQSFNEPSIPIPVAITSLTGVEQSDVAGKKIIPKELESFVEDCVLVIAHNAAFDRPFVERIAPAFSNISWACSATEIPWRDEGVVGSRLEYIVQSYSYFFDAHRALDDCFAVLTILSQELPISKRRCLSVLLENARQDCIRIFATGATYDTRSQLKKRGYRWNDGQNGSPRAWWRDVAAQSDLGAEISFLENVDRSIKPEMFNVNSKNRFQRNS